MTLFKRAMSVALLSLMCAPLTWSVAVASPVKVGLDVIEASKTGRFIDPRLRKVTSTLRSSFPKYTSFKLVKSLHLALAQRESQRVMLTKELNAELTLESKGDQGSTLMIKVPQKKASIRVKSRRGGLFFQAMRWKRKTYLLAVHGE